MFWAQCLEIFKEEEFPERYSLGQAGGSMTSVTEWKVK